MGHPKHPIFSGSTFGLMSGEKPLFQPQVEGGHEALGSALAQMGLQAEQTSGKYKEPERSYIIHNPTLDQMKQLGKLFGQESVIHSENGQHKLHYTNGEHEGKYHTADMQNPLEHFEQPPDDFYTSIPGHGHFRINFDWSKMHDTDPVNKTEREFEPELVAFLMKNALAELLADQAPVRAHPHAYDWHDGHSSHHETDYAAPQLPGLTKADAPGAHPHMDAPPKPANEQAAGVGVSTYKQFALPYGDVKPGSKPDLLHYNYHGKLPEISNLVQDHGYKTYYAGGKYGKPDLAHKNYNTGHLMVYDPSPSSGGDFGHENYTNGWRQIHELAHALTLPEVNKIYGEGRRMGKLGVHRNLNEALRVVHWEWLAAHKQRELSKQIGVPIKDEDFHKELNTVMHDAAHRAVTGKFTEPSGEGFTPHAHKVPLHTALQMVRDAGNQIGLKGLHDLVQKQGLQKAEGPGRPKGQPQGMRVGENKYYDGRFSRNLTPSYRATYNRLNDSGHSEKMHRMKHKERFEYVSKHHNKMQKADIPGLASPAVAGVTQKPALHNTVEGFMGALKAMPKGDPARGKHITAHMNHAPFLQALQAHPQGKQIHSMLTAHLNSTANAGFKPGATKVAMKSESPEAIFSKTEGDTPVADEKTYTPEEAREILIKATREKVDAYAKEIEVLRSRELKKALIPNHKHNEASQASSGVEDVPPGKINPKGLDKSYISPSTKHGVSKPAGPVPAPKPVSDADHDADKKAAGLKKEELCKKCGKTHALDKCGDMTLGQDPAKKAEEMENGVDKIVVHGDKKPTAAPKGADYTVAKQKGKTVIEAKKSELVDSKGKRTDNGINADSTLPEDKKPVHVNKPGKSNKTAGSGGIILPGSNLKKAEPLSKPPVSEAQRRAMGAAAGGSSTLGIPKKVGKEFIDADKGGKLPEIKKDSTGSVGGAGTPSIPKPKEPKKHVSTVSVSSANVTPGLEKAATPPMAKPPSGVNMGTSVPTSAPKAPKAPMAKGMLADAAKQADPISASHSPTKTTSGPKLPSPAEHAQRAAGFQAAAGGAFQPKPAAPKLPGAGLGLKSPKAAGVTQSAGPVMNAARPAKPGIFGKLFGKGEEKAEAPKCEKCGDPHATGDHAMAVLSEPWPKVLHPSDKKKSKK